MDDKLLADMGKRIYERRKHHGWTQEELAEQADLTPRTVSTAELGKKAMRPENIIKICRVLGISTDYLLLGTVTPDDCDILCHKLLELPPDKYWHLENIINSYLAAVKENKT